MLWVLFCFLFFKQKTAYEMRISDWSSDVCSSDLEAGLKYFVLGALSSGMLLYGASLVYGFAGTTGFAQLASIFAAGQPASIGMVIGIVFVSSGIAFKISAVPFHMWTPDVYEGAPTPVTAFFAVDRKSTRLNSSH